MAATQTRSKFPETWLDLEQIATVEVTSEHPNCPIESVFDASNGPGWREGSLKSGCRPDVENRPQWKCGHPGRASIRVVRSDSH